MHHHLSQVYKVKRFFQVDYPLANVIIFRKQISIVSLDNKLCFFPRRLDVKKHTIVEGSFTVHTSVVSVSLVLILVINVCFDIDVRGSFEVHWGYVLCVHHTNTHLIVSDRFSVKFPFLVGVLFALVMVNIYPTRQLPLAEITAVVMQLPKLDWFLL